MGELCSVQVMYLENVGGTPMVLLCNKYGRMSWASRKIKRTDLGIGLGSITYPNGLYSRKETVKFNFYLMGCSLYFPKILEDETTGLIEGPKGAIDLFCSLDSSECYLIKGE